MPIRLDTTPGANPHPHGIERFIEQR